MSSDNGEGCVGPRKSHVLQPDQFDEVEWPAVHKALSVDVPKSFKYGPVNK